MLVDNISRHKASSGYLYPRLRVGDTYQLCVKVSSASDSEICVLEYWTMLFYTFQLQENGLPIFDKQTKLGMEGLHKLFFPGEDFKGKFYDRDLLFCADVNKFMLCANMARKFMWLVRTSECFIHFYHRSSQCFGRCQGDEANFRGAASQPPGRNRNKDVVFLVSIFGLHPDSLVMAI